MTDIIRLAGLDVEIVGEPAGPPALVVLLHGYSMRAGDLSPFGRSLGVPARFLFPEGPIDLAPHGDRGRAWYEVDPLARAARLAREEPRDLSAAAFPGLPAARARLVALLDEAETRFGPAKLVVGGFSQGAMLACDMVLHTRRRVAGLVMLSGARITAEVWRPLLTGLEGLRILQSHGRHDPDLSFALAEGLKDELVAAGAEVTWVPFDGGHEIGLVVLRHLRRFLVGCCVSGATDPA